MSETVTEMVETRSQEFARLIAEYQSASPQYSAKSNAWNHLAEFAVDNCEFLRDALNEYVRPSSGQAETVGAVAVKPLIWGDYGDAYDAASVIGTFTIRHDGDEPDEWSLRLGQKHMGFYPTDQEAQDTAQAFFDLRIRSADAAALAAKDARIAQLETDLAKEIAKKWSSVDQHVADLAVALAASEADSARLREALTDVRAMLVDGQGEADALLVIDAALSVQGTAK